MRSSQPVTACLPIATVKASIAGWLIRTTFAFLTLALSNTAWAAEPTVEYYDVRGATMEQLRKAMQENGPVGKDGTRHEIYTKWQVFWNYKLVPAGATCKLVSINTRPEVTITMPKLVSEGEVPEHLQRSWESYSSALRIHANGYYDNAIGAAGEIERRLTGMSSTSGCKLLAEELNGKAKAVIDEYKAKDRAHEANPVQLAEQSTCKKPEYPADSRRNGEQGIVNASFLIGPDGHVIDRKIVRSSGFVNLDNAVLDALGKCSFKRAGKDVTPEPQWQPVQYVWVLQ
ncbi:TonB family protein [Massilia sp. PAMC28688]|uniref:TonB family protein n=1 Tax=Massilia sp. PAMC28688 TaxID=2861283 RepID=UPI001C6351F4|nr:TonB family protein [Massilia sp. PAMC28688]QYF93861.1 TonB family protein [Massilia sp. PAMC28688]